MGYLPLPYNKDRNKVFYKEMDNGLIVCVGIESSSLYQDRRKTVSFYTALSYWVRMICGFKLPQKKKKILCANRYSKRQESAKSKVKSYCTIS